MPRAAREKATAYKDGGRQGLVPASRHQPANFFEDRFPRSVVEGAAWIEHDIPFWANAAELQANRFAHTALHAVPPHGLAERAGCRESDAWPFGAVRGKIEGRKQRAGKALAMIIDTPEFAGSEQPVLFWEREPPGVVRQSYFCLA